MTTTAAATLSNPLPRPLAVGAYEVGGPLAVPPLFGGHLESEGVAGVAPVGGEEVIQLTACGEPFPTDAPWPGRCPSRPPLAPEGGVAVWVVTRRGFYSVVQDDGDVGVAATP